MRGPATDGQVRRWRLEGLRRNLQGNEALRVKPSRRVCAICGKQAGWCVVWDEGKRTAFVTFFCEGCKGEAEEPHPQPLKEPHPQPLSETERGGRSG
jgi:hypothetical protein